MARRLRGLRPGPGRLPTVRRRGRLVRRRSGEESPGMGRIWIGIMMGWGVSRTGGGRSGSYKLGQKKAMPVRDDQ